MDDCLLEEEVIDISSGRPDAGIELKSEDLITLLRPTIASILRKT